MHTDLVNSIFVVVNDQPELKIATQMKPIPDFVLLQKADQELWVVVRLDFNEDVFLVHELPNVEWMDPINHLDRFLFKGTTQQFLAQMEQSGWEGQSFQTLEVYEEHVLGLDERKLEWYEW